MADKLCSIHYLHFVKQSYCDEDYYEGSKFAQVCLSIFLSRYNLQEVCQSRATEASPHKIRLSNHWTQTQQSNRWIRTQYILIRGGFEEPAHQYFYQHTISNWTPGFIRKGPMCSACPSVRPSIWNQCCLESTH